MKIKEAHLAYEKEKFKASFGFKGSKLTGVWQTAVRLSDGANIGLGLGVQSVLWSDSRVFSAYGEEDSNRLMLKVTEFAVNMVKGMDFSDPRELLYTVLPEAYKYAKEAVSKDVSKTFVLNALVPIDLAAWMLYQKEKGFISFDSIYKGTKKAETLANIPLITYSTPIADVVEMSKNGTGIFKVKLGADPEGDGDLNKMLSWDKARIKSIHNALKEFYTPYTEKGSPVYYFDFNGRYDTKDRLISLIEFMDKEDVIKSTVLLEEPFDEKNKVYLGDIPLSFAADESVHSVEDVKERISLGYNTVTLKPIAKTLTMSIDMADYAINKGAQCFCADLTVNPVMVEWNKNFAARLPFIKGMKTGIIESNGAQNYVNWDKMLTYLNYKDNGFGSSCFTLDDEFYSSNGGIFEISKHYNDLFK